MITNIFRYFRYENLHTFFLFFLIIELFSPQLAKLFIISLFDFIHVTNSLNLCVEKTSNPYFLN